MTKTAKIVLSIIILTIMSIIIVALNSSKSRNGGAIGGISVLVIGAAVGAVAVINKQPTKYSSNTTNNYNKPKQIPQTPMQNYISEQPSQSELPSQNVRESQTLPHLISAAYDKENYRERLKRLCHPENFMDNYDKVKVANANAIYTEIFQTGDQNLHNLVIKAEAVLGLNFLDETDYNNLKEQLNPKNFMRPYYPQKIELANELYSRLLDPYINCTKFFSIKAKAKPLIDYLKEKQNPTKTEPASTTNWASDAQTKHAQSTKQNNNGVNIPILFASIGICTITMLLGILADEHKNKQQNQSNQKSTSSYSSSNAYTNSYSYSTDDASNITSSTTSPILKTYSSSLYTISYPEDWICKEHPNDNIDVIFGQEVGMAYSVFHINIDKSLQRIVEDGNKEMKSQFNATIVSNDKIKLCNVDCYKTVITFSLGNVYNKQISYALKKGKTYYNIRFNGSDIDIYLNEKLIETIIESFKLL